MEKTNNSPAQKPGDGRLENRLAGLPDDVSIDSWKEHSHTIELPVSWNEPEGDDRICPDCGSGTSLREMTAYAPTAVPRAVPRKTKVPSRR